jgi:hypothetical protein
MNVYWYGNSSYKTTGFKWCLIFAPTANKKVDAAILH